MTFRSILLFFFVIVFLVGCKEDNAQKENTPPPPVRTVQVPKFERDSAYNYIDKQVAFGPRVPNSQAHTDCKNWLVSKLKSFGAEVIEQDFKATAYTGTVLNSTNIIGQYNLQSKKRILLAAHWDSRHIADSPLSTERQEEPILGADDGASGVGVLLEIARQLQANPIDMGVDIIFFDAEDHGEDKPDGWAPRNEAEREQSRATWCLGAQHWSRNPHVAGYKPKYGILLDMVGSEGARFPVEEVSLTFAPQVVDKVWSLAGKMGYSNHFVAARTPGVTDDHYFVNTIAKIPMIDIINKPVESQTGFGRYWHTHNDNMEVISKRTLRSVGQLMLAVVYRENNGTL